MGRVCCQEWVATQLRALNIRFPILEEPEALPSLPCPTGPAEGRRGTAAPWHESAPLDPEPEDEEPVLQEPFAHHLRFARPAHPAVQRVMVEVPGAEWRLDYTASPEREASDQRSVNLAWSQGGLGEGKVDGEGQRCMGTTEVMPPRANRRYLLQDPLHPARRS